jgi:hypothetical protein
MEDGHQTKIIRCQILDEIDGNKPEVMKDKALLNFKPSPGNDDYYILRINIQSRHNKTTSSAIAAYQKSGHEATAEYWITKD